MSQYRAVCLGEIGLKLVSDTSIMLARLSAEVGETQRPKTTESEPLGGPSSPCHTGLLAERTG